MAGMGRALLLVCVVSLGARGAHGQDIFEASQDGNVDRVRALLHLDPAAVSAADERGLTGLHFAADAGRRKVVTCLLDAGADPEARDADGDTPLHCAALRGHLDVVELLLAAGADVNALNRGEETPLHHATWRRQLAVADLLLRRGAEVDAANDYQRTPLLVVARETGDEEFARLLLRHGADVNARDRFDDTPLSLAAWRGFRLLVDLFLDHGAVVEATGAMGRALTDYSAQRGLVRLFRQLTEAGADLAIGSETGGTLLHSAAAGGSEEITRLLLETGISLADRDCFGWTACHFAAARNRADVLEVLLERGADPNARTLAGWSAYNLAQRDGHVSILEVLERFAADTGPQRFPRLRGPYLGQEPPGHTPQLFARDIVSTGLGQHGSIVFSPDGGEAFWAATTSVPDSGYTYGTILTSKLEGGAWTRPRVACFATERDDDVPFFLPGGGRLYFVSSRSRELGRPAGKENIWMVEREGDRWGEPQPLADAVNDMPHHWQISVTRDTTLYFCSQRRLYKSKWVGGAHAAPTPLRGFFAAEFEGYMPFIAPDESFLLLAARSSDDGHGGIDLYVSFPDSAGAWGAPRNLGARVNTPAHELCPVISADGKYLFYMGRRDGCEGNYWIEADFIEELRTS
jgi:ankyrin repeat protein